LQSAATETAVPLVPGIYRHYKGQCYRVLGNARHSETLDELVVYQALYGEYGLWVRPAGMFAETVAVNGAIVPRFALEQAEPGFTPSPPSAIPSGTPP
jgi:hypothetical protein